MFLLISQASILLMARASHVGNTTGCVIAAPYKDQYGETDRGLVRTVLWFS